MNKDFSLGRSVGLVAVILALALAAHSQEAEDATKKPAGGEKAERFGSYKPNAGFKLVSTDFGDMSVKETA